MWPSLHLPGFYAHECLSQQKPNLCGTTATRSLSDSVSDTAVARPLGRWLCLLGCQIQGGLYNRSHPTHPPLLSAGLCWFTSTTSLLPTSQYIHPLLFSTPLLPYIYNKASLVMTHSSVHTVRIISLNVAKYFRNIFINLYYTLSGATDHNLFIVNVNIPKYLFCMCITAIRQPSVLWKCFFFFFKPNVNHELMHTGTCK